MAAAPGFQAVFVRPPNPPSCFEVFIIQLEHRESSNSGDPTQQRVGTIIWLPPQGDISLGFVQPPA